MNKEELKKLCKEEFLKNVKENIKSTTIFTYVDGLEKENKKQQQVIDKIKEYRKWLDENTVIYNSGECVKLNGTYWEAEGIKIILDKILEEIDE